MEKEKPKRLRNLKHISAKHYSWKNKPFIEKILKKPLNMILKHFPKGKDL